VKCKFYEPGRSYQDMLPKGGSACLDRKEAKKEDKKDQDYSGPDPAVDVGCPDGMAGSASLDQ